MSKTVLEITISHSDPPECATALGVRRLAGPPLSKDTADHVRSLLKDRFGSDPLVTAPEPESESVE